ncbi:MAG: preprotein translocase subunit YajC [Enterococcus sp.]
MGSLPMILMFVVLLGMWYFMSRTQKKQQQERQNLLDQMKKGDEVVTIGGLHGVISEINAEKSTILIDCEGIYLEYDRAAIKSVTPGTVVTNEATETAEPTNSIENIEENESAAKEEK